jgi:ribosomal protein L11 methyltransferase
MPRSTDPEKHPEQPRPAADGADVRENMLAVVAAATSKITPVTLQRKLRKAFGYDRRQVRDGLAGLVAKGELNYIDEAGRTIVEMAFNRPVRVSRKIFLVPAGLTLADEKEKVPVVIQPGAAFGDGRHPSTRLALTGLEWAVDQLYPFSGRSAATVLDIGTGSGVLLVAALRLGIGSGIGLDIDPCAVSEAITNIRLNGLAARAAASHHGIQKLDREYALICANLRWPTLKSMRDPIKQRLQPGGALLVSGIQSAEVTALTAWYAKAGFRCRWRSERCGWAAVVMQPADR